MIIIQRCFMLDRLPDIINRLDRLFTQRPSGNELKRLLRLLVAAGAIYRTNRVSRQLTSEITQSKNGMKQRP